MIDKIAGVECKPNSRPDEPEMLKSNQLAGGHSALRLREQDLRSLSPAIPLVTALDLDQLMRLQDGARKESIAGQQSVALPHGERDGKRRA